MANLRFLLLVPLCLILIPLKGSDTSITFIDVGQGDGIYINAGEDILIDCGSSSTKKIGRYTLEPFLKSQRINSVEKLFITHADSDHSNGILYLAEIGIFIDDLYLPASAMGDESYDSILAAVCKSGQTDSRTADKDGSAGSTTDKGSIFENSPVSGLYSNDTNMYLNNDNGPRIHYICAGDVITLIHGTITCMSPPSGAAVSDMNDQSLMLLYREDSFSALFTGDAGKEREQEMLNAIGDGCLPDIDHLTLLKAGHHGSSTSTSDDLLKASAPLVAVLSYGEGNRYGHPHPETVEKLGRYHVRTLHTAASGAVTVTTDGRNSVRISRYCSSD